MLEKVRSWVNRLPATSRNLPILHHNDRWWTPNEILQTIETCPTCPDSIELQRLLDMRMFGQDITPRELAKTRLLKALQMHPTVRFQTYTLGMPTITAEMLKREIQMETPIGEEFIKIEIGRVAREMSLYG